MLVVVRDPRHRKSGGRTPFKKPLSEPSEIVEVHGQKMTIRRRDGVEVKNVHFEDVVCVPDGATEPERTLEFQDDRDPLLVPERDQRRSPGLMIEAADARKLEGQDESP
jgi:hypothetical protein